MRIEILIDNEEPLIYPLDRPKIVVGSNESCDIVLNHKSISRKHLVIVSRDDKFFVSDQGSTNGSFINEQQLIPGKSAEFTSFFPVRLGDNVLVTLLSDEEAADLGPELSLNNPVIQEAPKTETTRMISLSDMQKSSTAALTTKRSESVAKRKTTQKTKSAPKKSGAQSNTTMAIAGLILMGGVAYYQFSTNKSQEEVVIVETKKAAPAPVVTENTPVKRISEEQLPAMDKILAAFKNPKCTQDIEKYLCVTLPNIFQESWGTVLVDKNIIIFADGLKYTNNAKSYLKQPLPEDQGGTKIENDTYNQDLSLLSLMLWMNDNVPSDLQKFQGMDDYTVTVVYIDKSAEEAKLTAVPAVFVPESFLRLRKQIQPKNFENAKMNGAIEFSYALEFLRFL